jgi:hypothetical protein
VDGNLLFLDNDLSGRIDKIPKQMAGSGGLIAVANLQSQEAIQATGHERQLQVTVDLHGYRRRQSIHMKKIDPIGNPIFNDHSLSVPFNQLGRGAMQLVGEQDRGFFMTKIFDDYLA